MNRRAISIIAVTGVLLLAAVIAIFSHTEPPPVTSEPSFVAIVTTTQALPEKTTVSSITALPMYMIGSWEDKLAVFAPPDTAPYQVYDVYLSTLPEEEQQRIKNGIQVFDESTLTALLEDYTS
ncbi:MAG: hypothetical protein PHH84_04400 [Oscillospiraceae bacterium]|nr:hypothetical protein [Oscillospiraceae bacterium]MDD4414178.1 hypothetical protein [Oscillospiraceae bacterium]